MLTNIKNFGTKNKYHSPAAVLWLLVCICINLASMVINIIQLSSSQVHINSTFFSAALASMALVSIAALLMLLFGRKSGFFILSASIVATMVLNVIETQGATAFAGVFSIVITYYFIRDRWNDLR